MKQNTQQNQSLTGSDETNRPSQPSVTGEVLTLCKGALAAISQPVTFTRARSEREYVRAYNILNRDCETARKWLQSAINTLSPKQKQN